MHSEDGQHRPDDDGHQFDVEERLDVGIDREHEVTVAVGQAAAPEGAIEAAERSLTHGDGRGTAPARTRAATRLVRLLLGLLGAVMLATSAWHLGHGSERPWYDALFVVVALVMLATALRWNRGQDVRGGR